MTETGTHPECLNDREGRPDATGASCRGTEACAAFLLRSVPASTSGTGAVRAPRIAAVHTGTVWGRSSGRNASPWSMAASHQWSAPAMRFAKGS